jgi:tetratricopeptide (TPR) repeat protein
MNRTVRRRPRLLARAAALALLFLCFRGGALPAQSSGDALDRAVRMVEQRRFAEAKPVLEAAVRGDPRNARAAFYLARVYRGERNSDQAIEWFEKAVRLDPNNSTYHTELAGALGEKALRVNRLRQATLAGRIRSHLEKAVELDPNNLEARFGLVQFYVVAPGMMGGSKQRARAEATAIKQRNGYVGARALALVHQSERNFAAAEEEYRAAIAQYPDSTAIYYGLGGVYVQTQEYDRAFELVEVLARRRPGDMGVLFQIGRLGAISGQRLDRAEQALKQYLQHQPTETQPPLAAAHWRLGMVYEKKGLKDLARQEYNAALRLDPNHREAREALKRLE